MSPRRKLEPDARRFGDEQAVVKTSRWAWLRNIGGLAGLSIATTLLVAAAIAVTAVMLVSHETDRRNAVNEASVLGYVGQFMTEFTSPDPFHANDYADRVLANATGDFAKEFKEKENAILVQVARAEPAKGTVEEAGIEKRYDDGSVSVLVATKTTTTLGDPKKPVQSGNRWVVTAVKEGQQWKISKLTPVI
ncbi:MAG TPA: mammalian cell entry protein [Mycobacterium sp.]|jgi:Mce-associated membrane protein